MEEKHLEKRLKKIEKQFGITLVALVVTMIVMLILAAVTVAQLSGDGLLNRTKLAKDKYKNSEETQDSIISQYQEEIEKVGSARDFSLDKVYPIGSIYITTSNENPTNTIGGTWESFGKGRTLVGAGEDSDGDDNGEKVSFSAGDKGGEYKHTLTVQEMPSHTHNFSSGSPNLYQRSAYGGGSSDGLIPWQPKSYTLYAIQSTGGSQSHNNIQPYIVTYMWKRTA